MSFLQEYPVTDSSPFPEIAVCEVNYKYAHILTQDLASAESELSAILNYTYQNWVLQDDHSEEAQIIKAIARVEMTHYHTLGRLIYLLGGNPKCQSIQNNRAMTWNGNMLNYNQSLKHILHFSLNGEIGAYNTYQEQARFIKDPKVSAILLRISLDEKCHVEIFRALIGRLSC